MDQQVFDKKSFPEKLSNFLLQELPVHQRADAVSSLVYEANARMRDPVYGCVGAISYLQNQVSQLQMQLAVAQAEILCIQMQKEPNNIIVPNQQIEEDPADQLHHHHHHHHDIIDEEKSYYLQNTLSLPHQYLNFASSSSNVIHESLKRESIFGYDMVS